MKKRQEEERENHPSKADRWSQKEVDFVPLKLQNKLWMNREREREKEREKTGRGPPERDLPKGVRYQWLDM